VLQLSALHHNLLHTFRFDTKRFNEETSTYRLHSPSNETKAALLKILAYQRED
jgi:hypothetical protein